MLNNIRDKLQNLPESVVPNSTDWYKDRKVQQHEFMLKEKNREIEDRNQKIFSRLSKIQYVSCSLIASHFSRAIRCHRSSTRSKVGRRHI